MGRHWKIPQLRSAYTPKEFKLERDRKFEEEAINNMSSRERLVTFYLHYFGQNVLEAAGKGYILRDREYALELLKKLKEVDDGNSES